MMSGRVRARIGLVMMGLGMIVMVGGCSKKHISSAAGEQATAQEKGAPAGGVETVKQEQVAVVETPAGRSAESPSPVGPAGAQDMQGSRLTPTGPGSDVTAVSKGAGPSAEVAGLGDIYFDFDMYNIRKDAQLVLEDDARWFRSETGKTVLIEGHCDERGTLAYNLVLGEKRARSAKRYLQDLGIPASRMQTTSYGEVRPFCKEHNEKCWQLNRRAHFVVR